MKTAFFIFSFIVSVSVAANNNSIFTPKRLRSISDTTVLPQILSLPLSTYIGQPVDSLLLALPSGYSSRGFMSMGVGHTNGIYQSYFTSEFNNCAVEIYIDTFNFLSVPNRTPKSTWNINLAKQETIAFIKVFKINNICVYGCNNPNYYH